MQAILISAHKDVDQLIQLCSKLHHDFVIYIHFDTKCHLTDKQKRELSQLDVNYFSKINVHWSAWSVAQASIELMKECLKNKDIDYVHFISGQDWLLRSPQEIKKYFENNRKGYIYYHRAADVVNTGEPIILWEKLYFNYDKMKRKSIHGKIFHRLSILAQLLCRVNKFKKYHVENLTWYSGSQWVDLPRDMVVYLLQYLRNNPNFLKVVQRGYCSDEFWMPTILLNSPKFASRIVNANHRYILRRDHIFPATLDDRDFKPITEGLWFFGRKFISPQSDHLMAMINKKYNL